MASRRVVVRILPALLPSLAVALMAPAAGPSAPERVSIGEGGEESDGDSYECALSANGRFVVFRTNAANLVPGTANGGSDVVLRDLKEGTNLLVSHSPSGTDGDGGSADASVSGNGRFVAFYSTSSDLVDSDGNANPDVFLADTRSGDVTRISETPGGGTPNGQSYAHGVSISKSGRHAVFYSQASDLAEDDANGKWDVFLHDRVRGTTALVSRNPAGAPANGDSMHPSLSPNGRFVAYHSAATDLVEGETGTNSEVYVFDTRSGTTTKASPGLSGADAAGGSLDPVVSDNGRWVAFFSYAGNLVPDDTNGRSDVFLFDRKTGALRLLSVREDGTRGDGYSYTPAMSANGKSLVFFTEASNLVAGDANGSATDVVHVDVKTGALTLLSADAAGAGGDGSSYVYPAGLSSGGRRVVFFSAATNLVAADANGRYDVFVARLK